MKHGEIWGFLETGAGEALQKIATECRRLGKKLNLRSCGLLVSDKALIPDEAKGYLPEKIYISEIQVDQNPESFVNAIMPVIENYRPFLIIFGASPFSSDVAAGLAAKLNVGLCSNIIDLEPTGEKIHARKSIYDGKAHALLSWNCEPPYIATMDLSSLEAISAEAASTPEITKMKVNPRHQRTTFLKKWQVGSDALDISEADVVVGVGNGVEEDETMGMVKQLAKQLNASIGGSRIARYKGLVHEENQIGISGKRISALVYLALGISGAPYHIMGTKDVKHLIAVNKDKMARIFKYAEVGVVTDLRDLLPKLIELMHPEV